ncbi:hypothetical protein GGI03_002526 [Coemansia sp. RSA 2337]|nr:hypothetical protein GGI14_000523 [Coemansia sp. S680]KAJ2041171.1 hypothetical protein H4S03_000554 [Coemansia sp. S3946]KAJ2042578.1 hypothetical protein H4S04_007220 [Coemansia sp. S16]KAJ2055275.1 hypothetical protein GGH13_007903 [Coemansia sp. S155-1]KAJ2097134.1 hypothetical protein GGI16_004649 [Coemansia sp. S142-1]KAJ2114517.1 hypothetical protein IW146_003033 [Coemansia sp. RSA 922]KAJ2465686.1 hypothetical protein GGI03_002526 [Coemansia sp. RSA 2337]
MFASIEYETTTRIAPKSPDAYKASSQDSVDASSQYQFIDFRAAASPDRQKRMPPIVEQIITGLATLTELPGGSTAKYRTLPTLLLYDNTGLDLFDRITYLPEYYLTDCEIDVLRTNIDGIVAQIPDDSDVIELGCGSLRKTQILLDALNQRRSGVTYYAIDVMPQPLHDSMDSLAPKFVNVSFVALCGTYDEVLTHFKKSTRRKTLLWLGSSIGNFSCDGAVKFLTDISDSALAVNDAVIIGMDKQKAPEIIMAAYHDSQDITVKFELNALSHANYIFSSYIAELNGSLSASDERGACIFDVDKFRYTGEYDEEVGRHNAYLEALEDTLVKWPREIAGQVKELCGNDSDLLLKRGERIYIESSHKYGDGSASVLARSTGLTHAAQWQDSRSYYMLNLFRKPPATMSPPPAIESSSLGKWSEPIHRVRMMLQQPLDLGAQSRYPTIPSLPEWRHLWSAWDALVLHIIPRRCLHDRPIDLRHPFIFYLGHVPAFADIHMAAAEKAPLTEPQSYAQWFERGIDPNIENLSICHSHSEVPKEWPLLDDILAYRDRVRARFANWFDAYERGGRRAEADAARHVWMAFEHEALHFETLLYMVLQMNPEDIQAPIEASFAPLGGRRPRESWVRYAGGSDLVFGLAGDNESAMQGQELPSGHVFGWDNESSQIRISLKPFSIRSQPITNGEYLAFLQTLSGSSESVDGLVPQSWISLNHEPALTGDYGVRTVVGMPSITTTEAAMWPVCVSQKQANAYAKWSGKRLPTEAEWIHASRTYHLARALATGDRKAEFAASKSVDGFLDQEMNPGSVQEILQQPYDMFVPSDANVDLASWHPQPVIADGAIFIGNAWEWTSTQFYPYDGFKPSAMYPGYSADFFDPISDHAPDSTHYVVQGGSYATHRRIAHRQTFRNWYQRGYPYVLATFRLVDEY